MTWPIKVKKKNLKTHIFLHGWENGQKAAVFGHEREQVIVLTAAPITTGSSIKSENERWADREREREIWSGMWESIIYFTGHSLDTHATLF